MVGKTAPPRSTNAASTSESALANLSKRTFASATGMECSCAIMEVPC